VCRFWTGVAGVGPRELVQKPGLDRTLGVGPEARSGPGSEVFSFSRTSLDPPKTSREMVQF
jgi:hypothetical protein